MKKSKSDSVGGYGIRPNYHLQDELNEDYEAGESTKEPDDMDRVCTIQNKTEGMIGGKVLA